MEWKCPACGTIHTHPTAGCRHCGREVTDEQGRTKRDGRTTLVRTKYRASRSREPYGKSGGKRSYGEGT
jgi:uncharacterized OB-fold protein